jgi:AcrR family transcriptional regulator
LMRIVRPMISAEFVADHRRRAITDALAELCVEQGYRATTIADVVARARTSRNTLYEYFDNGEQIFLTLLDRAIGELVDRTKLACRDTEPEERVEAGLAAVLAWVAEEPVPAYACFVEATCATPESFRRYLEAITEFATLLRGNVPTEIPRPSSTEESLVGGVASILRFRIVNGEAKGAPELLPELTNFLRLPFLAIGPS